MDLPRAGFGLSVPPVFGLAAIFAGAGDDDVVPAFEDGPDGAAEAAAEDPLLALLMSGSMVAFEAGFKLDVWPNTKSYPALATTKGKTAPAAFLTSAVRSSRHEMTGAASGERSAPGLGGSACNLSPSQASTEDRSAGLVVSSAVARPW